MNNQDVGASALSLLQTAGGLLGVVVTLVALVPTLTEIAFRGADSEYERLSRSRLISTEINVVKYLIPIFSIVCVIASAAWYTQCDILLEIAVTATCIAIIVLGYGGYRIAQSLRQYILQHR